MRSTFKVLFYVKKGSEKPNGNLPLMCRITVDGEIQLFQWNILTFVGMWQELTDMFADGHIALECSLCPAVSDFLGKLAVVLLKQL